MVIDPHSNYSSPAGREFTLAAGYFAGINPSSRIADLGCGFGDGACTMAGQFRCRVVAIDLSQENIEVARRLAVKKNVSHLISFERQDILDADFSQEPFELILAEGGILSYISRGLGLSKAASWLLPRGWFAFSDLIFLSKSVPAEIKKIFQNETYHYESESSYRSIVADAGFDIHLMSLVPQSGWDNYYAHMARRLEDQKGFFSDRRIKLGFHKEIDAFYRLEAFRYVGYLFCIARKKDSLKIL
jgi:cyclopropane fatty-acyl-phospholipid synthase-like methyltransferase